MKKLFLFLLLILSISYLQAQEENNDIQTLFKKPSKVRGYFGSISNITTLNGENAYMSGMQAAGIFNDHIIFGFYRLNLENSSFTNDNFINPDYELEFDHRGFILGYIFMPKRIIHFNTNLQLGQGDLDIYNDAVGHWTYDDFVFVVSPSVEVEFNVVKFLRIGIGANYRFAFDVDEIENYKNEDFSDFGAFVSFKFGWFK